MNKTREDKDENETRPLGVENSCKFKLTFYNLLCNKDKCLKIETVDFLIKNKLG